MAGKLGMRQADGMPGAMRASAADLPHPVLLPDISVDTARQIRRAIKRAGLKDVIYLSRTVRGYVLSPYDAGKYFGDYLAPFAVAIDPGKYRAVKDSIAPRKYGPKQTSMRVWRPEYPGDTPEPLHRDQTQTLAYHARMLALSLSERSGGHPGTATLSSIRQWSRDQIRAAILAAESADVIERLEALPAWPIEPDTRIAFDEK